MRDAIAVFIVAAFILLLNLGGPKLWDRDEPRNAGCAREMLERNDWVVPYFNGELRTHKPILLYWLLMASYSLFGVSEFAARLPSSLLAIGTVLMTFQMARLVFDQIVARWAAVILATFVMFPVVGRAATPDSSLIFFSTAALAAFLHSYHRDLQRVVSKPCTSAGFHHWESAATIYGLMGAAVLAKGPVGFVMPTAVIGMFCLIKRLEPSNANGSNDSGRLFSCMRGPVAKTFVQILRPFHPTHFLKTYWSMRPVTGIFITLLVAAPWYVWVGIRTDGVWLQEFFGEHNVGRAMRSMEGHSGSPFFLLPDCAHGVLLSLVSVFDTRGIQSST